MPVRFVFVSVKYSSAVWASWSSLFNPNKISSGKTGFLPNTRLQGIRFVLELSVVLNANITSGNTSLHWFCGIFLSSDMVRRISRTDLMFLSANPFHCEWYSDDRRLSIANNSVRIVSPCTFEPGL